jgi:hypothetical protein
VPCLNEIVDDRELTNGDLQWRIVRAYFHEDGSVVVCHIYVSLHV